MTITKKALGAAIAVAALGVSAPPASASHEFAHCRFAAASQFAVTGNQTWEGSATGYVAVVSGEAVSVRCVIRVSGGIRAATGWGSGSALATVVDRLTYVQAVSESAALCVQLTSSEGFRERCMGTTAWPLLPDAPQYAVGYVALSP